jgi:hypothetical protein
MALKDIWQQDRQTRQAELKVRQEAVVQLRSKHQSDHAAMATQLRTELSQVLPKLRLDEAERQLEAQCAQAGRTLEAAARRQEVQQFLYDLHQRRCEAADDLRLLLEEFRADRKAQSAAINLMLQETRKTRETEVAALFERFAEEKLDRQAAVQAIRDYVWGDASPQAVNAEAIEAILKLAVQESVRPEAVKPEAVKPEAKPAAKPEVSSVKSATKPEAKPEVSPVKPEAKPEVLSAVKAEVKAEVKAKAAAPIVELPLTERLLATVNSLSGVRLSDLESTLSVTRSELVQALQQLIRSGDIVQRDRAYYSKTQTPASANV